MGMSEPERIKNLQFNFSNFLWRNLTEIHEQEAKGNYVDALILSLDLVKYLPPAVERSLREDVEKIKHSLRDGVNVGGHHYVRMLIKNRRKQALAKKFLDEFIRKMIALLDKRGYLEQRTSRYTIEDFPRLDVEGEA